MTVDRAQLRHGLRAARRATPAAERISAAQALAVHLLALPFFPAAGAVAGYWAMDGEIALHAWQLQLPKTITYCLPVLCADEQLRFAPWRAGAPLVTGRFGIPEPDVPLSRLMEAAALDLVVVPLVGFDARCHRLGMGGGWYDRSFAFRIKHSAPPWLVGAAFSTQRIDRLPAQPWDVRLDAVCTERDYMLQTESIA